MGKQKAGKVRDNKKKQLKEHFVTGNSSVTGLSFLREVVFPRGLDGQGFTNLQKTLFTKLWNNFRMMFLPVTLKHLIIYDT